VSFDTILSFMKKALKALEGGHEPPEPVEVFEFMVVRGTTPGQLEALIEVVEVEHEVWSEHGVRARPALHPFVSERLGVYTLDPEIVGRLLGYPECCVRYFLDGHVRYDHEGPAVVTEGFVPCSRTCEGAVRARLLDPEPDVEAYREVERELEGELGDLPRYHTEYRGYYEYHGVGP